MKKRKIWPLVLGLLVLAIIAIIAGVVSATNDVDLSIITGFSAMGAVACLVLAIVFASKNSKLQRVDLSGSSTNSGSAKKAEIYVPEEIAEFDRAVRLHFQEFPYKEYSCPNSLYEKLKAEAEKGRPTVNTLQTILIDMEHHLGMKNNQSIITLEKIEDNRAGYIEKQYYSFNDITVGYRDIYNADCYLAILAHELSHAYQYYKMMQNLFSDKKMERFTDVLTFYLGFGRYTKAGKTVKRTKTIGFDPENMRYQTETVTLGYMNEGDFPYVEMLVNNLREQKERAAKEKAEQVKAVEEIDKLLDAISIYFETIQSQLNNLKNKKFSEDELKTIQGILMRFDSDYLNRLKASLGEYKKMNLAQSKEKLSFIRKEMEEAMKATQDLNTILGEN